MKPLEKFIQNNRAKTERSKIWPFRAEIFKLAELDYSAKQIAEFVNSKIKKKDEKVHTNTVLAFLKKHKKLKTKEKINYVEVQTPVKEVIQPKRIKKEKTENEEMGYHAAARENANKPTPKSDNEILDTYMGGRIKPGSELEQAQKMLNDALEKERIKDEQN
jgi:hypothetical protein